MRILPEMKAWIVCPFSSLTRNVAFGRFSTTSPCSSMTSSLAMASARRQPALEVGFAQQALVLVSHDVGLHLRHEVHRHDDDDQQRRAAEVERYVPPQDQEFRQQAHHGHVNRPAERQAGEDFLRSEEHTSELQSLAYLVCRLLLEKKKHEHNAAYVY